MTALEVRRGDLFFADLNPVVGSEQGGVRPVLVIQNDVGNRYSPTVIVAAVSAQVQKGRMPTHVELPAEAVGLERDSVVLLEQIRTIDKRRLRERVARVGEEIMAQVDEALLVSLGLEGAPAGWAGDGGGDLGRSGAGRAT